jgi:pyrroline-5-carboxylate reductase
MKHDHQGVTLLYANSPVRPDQLKLAESLFSTVGEVAVLEDEGLFNAATAISGCGPAYFYHLADSLTQAAGDVGLSEKIAEKLAHQTFIGASALLINTSESASTLKNQVARPGGITEAALKVLENSSEGLSQLMSKAVHKAVERSRELSQN